MTDDEARARGLRALAAGYRWTNGALAWSTRDTAKCGGDRVIAVSPDGWLWFGHGDWVDPGGPNPYTPMFDDPATLGTLLAQVLAIPCPSPEHLFTRRVNDATFLLGCGRFDLEVASRLVAALEAAPASPPE